MYYCPNFLYFLFMSQALIMLCKYPIPGQVKTRIAADTSDQIAADIQSRMLRYIISTHCNHADYDLVIWLRHADLLTQFESEYSCYHEHNFVQQWDNLGEIIDHAIHYGLHHYDRIIIIGSDTPLITNEDILWWFTQLDNTDIVLWPVTDGWYWCIGSLQLLSEIVIPIIYSTESVLQNTIDQIQSHGLNYSLLDTKTDIDTIDLRNNISHLIP